jgi:hypothetical protein
MPARTPPTHYLFLRIIALVGQSTKPMTVDDLSKALNIPSDDVAQCIALHSYFEKERVAELPMPLPVDYWVPTGAEVITSQMLRPKQAGRMLAVERVLRDVLGSNRWSTGPARMERATRHSPQNGSAR